MSRIERVQELRAKLFQRYDRGLDEEYATAIEELTSDEGALLARQALAAMSSREKRTADCGESELLRVACLVPDALQDLHVELFARGIFYPGTLYLGAQAEARDRLISRVERRWWRFESGRNGFTIDHLLQCLAWIGDDVICSLFDSWRRKGTSFRGLLIPPWQYAHEAGWELDETGRRRDLISKAAYALVPSGEIALAGRALDTVTAHDGACGWCSRELTTLFNCDLRDARVASIVRMPGERLRIAMCDRCTAYSVVYTDVDGTGRSTWSEANVRPHFLGRDGDEWERPPQHQLSLGPLRRSPYGTRLFVRECGNSQLGGFATWFNDAEHPPFTRCHRPMPLVGQVDWSDIEDFAEGVTYAFLCADCGVAATSYGQT